MSKNDKKKNKKKGGAAPKDQETKSTWFKDNAGIIAIIAGVVCIAVIVLIVALSGSTPPDDKPPLVTDADVPTKGAAAVYIVDEWKETFDDETKKYYITLAMHSEDYYAEITPDDVQFFDGKEYKPLTSAIEGAIVEVYNVNDTKKGICSYAKITTDTLIDTKKIYTKLAGPIEYDAEALTKEAYVAKYGSDDGWCSNLTTITTKPLPREAMFAMQTSIGYGVCRLGLGEAGMYYYTTDSANYVINGDTIMTKMDVVQLKSYGLDRIVTEIKYCQEYANIDNGVASRVELCDNIEVVSEIVDNCIWFGFKTIDGSDINDYLDQLPDAMTIYGTRIVYFVVK